MSTACVFQFHVCKDADCDVASLRGMDKAVELVLRLPDHESLTRDAHDDPRVRDDRPAHDERTEDV